MRSRMFLILTLVLVLAGTACRPALQADGPPSPTAARPAEPLGKDTPPQQALQSIPSVASGQGSTYYVRPDGGSPAQCNGRADAPYTGASQDCAWDHPFRALPPDGSPRIQGGDALVIASGSYMMGYGAPGADNCDPDGAFECHMPPVPSGPNPAHPTRILGAGWNAGCPNPPELWGTQRPWYVLNLTDSSNVEIACLEITDHSACVEDHTGGLACQRDNYPFGEWAPVGIHAEDSANVHLRNLDIHGLASIGIHAGRLTDWTVENVRVAGNGSVGWDGDLWDGDDSNSGTLIFRHWTVEWNGCGETYPGGEPTGCWGQEAGGYGDGVGTGATGGDWIIEDSAFLHNTSDGLDLLYHSLGGRVVLNRVHAEGNAGNRSRSPARPKSPIACWWGTVPSLKTSLSLTGWITAVPWATRWKSFTQAASRSPSLTAPFTARGTAWWAAARARATVVTARKRSRDAITSFWETPTILIRAT